VAAAGDGCAPAAPGEPETLGFADPLGAVVAGGGACEGDGWVGEDAAVGVADAWAEGDAEGLGVRVEVTAGDGVLVGVAFRDDGSAEGERTEVGDGLIVGAGTTTAGEPGTSAGRTKR